MSDQIIDVVAHNKQAIIVALHAHGIAKVVVEYYGGGDSGGTEEIRLELENGETVAAPSGVVAYAHASRRYNVNTHSFDVDQVEIREKSISCAVCQG